MAIDGRVHESLRRQLGAARPLVIDGAHDLDGCWALDRCVDASGAPTVVRQVLDDVRALPAQRATIAVAARMAEHLQRYRWPDDLVVSPVPSNDPVVDLLARAVAVHLEVPCVPLLRLRASVRSSVRAGHVEQRVAVRARLVPAHVLLIDDLVSTGRTLRACGSALRLRGAQAVWAMVAAADVPTDVDDLRRFLDTSATTDGSGTPDTPGTPDAPDTPDTRDGSGGSDVGAGAGGAGEGLRQRGVFTDVWLSHPERWHEPADGTRDETFDDAGGERPGIDPEIVAPDIDVADIDVADIDVADIDVADIDVADIDVAVDDDVPADVPVIDSESADGPVTDELSADAVAGECEGQTETEGESESEGDGAVARVHRQRAKRRNRRAHKR